MDYKYQTLEKNRDQLKTDCEHIRDNIDDFKGKLSYINYDIGTGKSYGISRIIPELVKNGNRVLVLCYSYAVAMEWNENIKKALQKAEVDSVIYFVSSPVNFNKQDNVKCNKIKEKESRYIEEFTYKECKDCKDKQLLCLHEWKKKLKQPDIPITITSQSFYFIYQSSFTNFDVIIFDEIESIDSKKELDYKFFDQTYNLLNTDLIKEIPEAIILRDYIDSHILTPMKKYYDDYRTISTDKDCYYYGFWNDLDSHILKDSIDILLKNMVDKIKKLPIRNNLKDLISKLNRIRNFYSITRSWYIIPETKSTLTENSDHGYRNYQYDIVGTTITARKVITLPGLHTKTARKPAYLVLSALNTKDYIENLFQYRIPDSHHLGKNKEGKILINRFSNVICTTYSRKSSHKDKGLVRGYGKTKSLHLKSQITIAKNIESFIEAFKGERIAIGGTKNFSSVFKWNPFKNPTSDDMLIYNDIARIGIKNKIVDYDDYQKADEEERKTLIPYVHFGISGTNDLADFRAILIINRFQIPESLKVLYCDAEHDEFAISEDSFHFNKNIAQARQLEGRLLRFNDNAQYKYLFRMNDYDKSYSGKTEGNQLSFPDCTTPLFNFKTQKLLNQCILGLKEWNEYTSLKDSVKKSININLWKDIFDSIENGNRIYKDRRLMTFITTKYIEFYYKKREEYAKPGNEKDTNAIPISIKDIDAEFFENYFRSTKNQRRYNENREKIYAVMHELIAGFPYLTELMN